MRILKCQHTQMSQAAHHYWEARTLLVLMGSFTDVRPGSGYL